MIFLTTFKILERQHDIVKKLWALEPKRPRFKPCFTVYVALKNPFSDLQFSDLYTYFTEVAIKIKMKLNA